MKRKFVSLISLVLAALALLALAGCHTSSVTADEDVVVIRASAEQDGMTLLAVMEELQEEGELSFTVSDGMITELNGTKQTPVELLDALHERSGERQRAVGYLRI